MVLLADMETLILGIVTAGLALMGTIFTGVMAYLMAKLNTKQTEAAVKVEEVAAAQAVATIKVEQVAIAQRETKDTVTKKLDHVVEKVEEVHKATNGMVKIIQEYAFTAGEQSEKDKQSPDRG